MLIHRNPEGAHGQRKVGSPCADPSISNHIFESRQTHMDLPRTSYVAVWLRRCYGSEPNFKKKKTKIATRWWSCLTTFRRFFSEIWSKQRCSIDRTLNHLSANNRRRKNYTWTWTRDAFFILSIPSK